MLCADERKTDAKPSEASSVLTHDCSWPAVSVPAPDNVTVPIVIEIQINLFRTIILSCHMRHSWGLVAMGMAAWPHGAWAVGAAYVGLIIRLGFHAADWIRLSARFQQAPARDPRAMRNCGDVSS